MKSLFLLLALVCLFSCKQSPKIAEWRGTDRTGIYNETNLLKSWPANGPDVIWETEAIGNGYSSPIVTDEFIYVTGEIDSLGYLFKLDKNGKEIMRTKYGVEWTQNFPGSRGTPTLVDDLVYLCSGMGEVICMNAETGEKIWEKNMLTEFNGVIPRFGYAQALTVDGDKVFCMPGGEENNVVALNRFSGEVAWTAKCFGERPGYNSPRIIERGGKKILTTFSAYHLLGVDTENGNLLWSHEQTNVKPEDRKPGNGDTHGNTVLYEDGTIYYSAGDGNGGVKLHLSDDGSSIEQIWQNKVFDNYMSGIIKVNDQLFGSSHTQKQLIAIDCATGEKTDSLEIGRGITIFADGDIYYYDEKGQVHLVNPASGLKEVSSFKLAKESKEHFTHPVIQNGILYVRHSNFMEAYSIRKES